MNNAVTKRKNHIYLAVGDELLSDELAINIQSAGFQLSRFSTLHALDVALDTELPLAVIIDIVFNVDMIFDEGETAGLDMISLLKKKVSDSSRIIFISERDNTKFRMATASSGVDRYFYKPLVMKKFIQTLHGLKLNSGQNPYRVLLIDDEAALLDMYTELLHNSGMEAVTLTNPLEILNVLTEFKPDVIVVDFYMPECTGAELVKFIRQDDNWALIPIIFLSGETNVNSQLAAIEHGGEDFLEKTIPAKKFTAMIHAWAARSRKNIQLNNALKNALRENQFQIETMDQHNIVSSTDITGRILSVNEKFCDISGYSKEELLGQNHRLLKSDFHSKEFYEELWATISNGKIWRGMFCNHTKQGEEYWVNSTIVPFLNERGKPYKYISARTDVTDLRASQERLQRSQDFAKIGTWDWDIRTNELHWSEYIWKILGYDKENTESNYENFINAVHPDDRQLVINAVTKCVEDGSEYNLQHRIVWPDGSIHWVYESGNVLRNNKGTPTHMLGVVQDITHRVTAEEKLRESEHRFTHAVEGIGDAVWDWNLQTNNIKTSQHGMTMLGYDKDEFEPTFINWVSLIHPEDLAHDELNLKYYLKGMISTFMIEHRLRCKDGSYKWIITRGSEVDRSSDGKISRMIGIHSDISTRKKAEAELILAQQEAEMANKAKSQFLSSMSHELRTPMNAIIGFTQLLQMDVTNPLSDTQSSSVHEIMKAGDYLLILINQLLDLAKIETGHIELTITPVILGKVVKEAIQLVKPLAKKHNITIRLCRNNRIISFDQLLDVNIVVFADYTRLKQVIINLLSNAIKYNSVNGEVKLSCQDSDNSSIRISVTDTGEGLNQEQQKLLFKAFNRLGAESSKVEGTGIGLVISKNIIEQMNGRIGVESAPGEGSTFWIEIPRDMNYVDAVAQATIENKLPVDAVIKIKQKSKSTVLYIEDNRANLKLVSELLGRLPYINMLSADEPQHGIDMARQHHPDLILLDINLPGMDGYKILDILKSDETMRDIPVIAVSANAMTSDITKGMDAGFYDYITKPIDVMRLLLAVDKVLSETS